MSGPTAVLSVGASTPIGIDARQTALLIRSCKSSPRSSPFRDERGNTLGTVRSLRLDDSLVGIERLVALATPALRETIESLPPAHRREHADDKPVVLLLNLPEPWEGESVGIDANLLGAIAKSAQVRLDERSSVIRMGHAGFAALLTRASMFAADVRVIVGAVDSYHDAARVKTMDANYRILSGHAGNGFIPSEGASFACVSASRRGADRPLAIVKFVACADEEVPYPPLARALGKLTRDERLPRPLPWVVSDANGEHHRVREWTYTRMRNFEVLDPDPSRTICHYPYRELGELGAATGAVYLAYVAMGFRLGFAPARSALVVTSSEGPARGTFYVEAPE